VTVADGVGHTVVPPYRNPMRGHGLGWCGAGGAGPRRDKAIPDQDDPASTADGTSRGGHGPRLTAPVRGSTLKGTTTIKETDDGRAE